MTTRTLRVGVAGVGNIATIAQLPTLVARDDVELTAVVTRRADPQPLMRRWGFGRAYSTVDAMLEAETLDAVFILTPRSEHVEATRSALAAGVDVFCEKPLATRTEDALSLAQQADEGDRILMVGFNRRFAPVYEAGREAFGSRGASFCVAQKNRAGSEYRATFENAIHMVDLLRWYCGGEPVEVNAHAAGDDPWQEDGVSALIRFDSGNTGVLMAARNAGAWSEKLDAYGDGVTATISAPDSVAITREGQTTVREMSAEAFGWAPQTADLRLRRSGEPFPGSRAGSRQPLTSGAEAAKTQLLLDRILRPQGCRWKNNPDVSGPATRRSSRRGTHRVHAGPHRLHHGCERRHRQLDGLGLREGGATVIASDRGGEKPEAAVAYYDLDVTDEEATAAAIADVIARFGRIDALVHAAGVLGRPPTL